jgi:Spy/CpxP family protein refolding chaperone
MKSNVHYHFSTKTALAMMLASAAVYTANINAADPAKPDPAVAQQLSDAQAKAAQLQGKLAQNAPRATASPATSSMPGMAAPAASASPMPGMSGAAGGMKPGGMGDDKMMMGKMDLMMNKMDKMMPMMEKMMGGRMGGGGAMPAAAPAAGMSGGGGIDDDKMEMAGMMGMDAMGGGTAAAMPDSALPGFPGASHLYHIGATGFFLDHAEHITLTTEQQVALNKIKDQALLAKSAADRAIEQAEQELGKLTAAEQPDIGKTEAKVREIAKMNGDERLAFIRAVGEAAKLLTADQRKILTGFAPPAPAMAAPSAAVSATPMPMNDM